MKSNNAIGYRPYILFFEEKTKNILSVIHEINGAPFLAAGLPVQDPMDPTSKNKNKKQKTN